VIDPDEFFIIAHRSVSEKTGLGQAVIRDRLCRGTVTSRRARDYRPGQPTTVEDDGTHRWVVTRTPMLAPDMKKRIAYVVKGHRYQEES
jgi:hypothetical protein